MVALGAISSLYCLYHLDHPEFRSARMEGFACEGVAPRSAIVGEIQRSLPGTSKSQAETILDSLVQVVDREFLAQRYEAARLPGFGVLHRLQPPLRSAYTLQIELPLSANGNRPDWRVTGANG